MPLSGGSVSANIKPNDLVLVHLHTGGYREGVVEEIDWESDTVYLSDKDGAEFEAPYSMLEKY